MNVSDLLEAKAVSEVAKMCRVSEPTIYRWITNGVVVGGKRVKLAAVRIGGHRVVLLDAVSAFITACNPDAVPVPESESAIRRRGEADQRRLAAMLGGGL